MGNSQATFAISAREDASLRHLISVVLVSALLSITVLLRAQGPPEQVPLPTIRANTRMILVSVVATDKSGPVTDLAAKDFSVLEAGRPQKLSAFAFEKPVLSDHAFSVQKTASAIPANVYTNRPDYLLAPGPLTILLIDALNTPIQDQIYFRQELLRYVETQVKPGQRLAIFLLESDLHLLQDFTSDPELLRRAVESFQPRTSLQLAQEQFYAPPPPSDPKAGPAYLKMLRTLKQLAADHGEVTANQKVAATLAAFRTIARSVAGYRGRKNLIWMSASFPLAYQAQLAFSFEPSRIQYYRNYEREIRQTANIMGDAQISIYPVDARGLEGAATVDASKPMSDELGEAYSGATFAEVSARSSDDRLNAQASMEEVADLTGGRAFKNRNDIDHAVALSVADGSSYYTLAYHPTNKSWHGEFRKISIRVARKGVHLRYRDGYFAADAGQELRNRDAELVQALRSDAPPATMVVFDARVFPARIELPEREYGTKKYLVDFMVDARTISSQLLPDGGHHFNLEFHAVAFSPDGVLAAHADTQLNTWASRANDEVIRANGLPFHTSLQLGPGRYKVRLVVRDVRTGYLGSVDVPLAIDEPDASN